MNYKKIFFLLMLLCNVFLLSACWDKRELTKIFVVIGMAIDKAEEEGMFELTVQVMNTSGGNTQEQGSSGSSEGALLFSMNCTNVTEGIKKINQRHNRELFLQHNKIIVISEEIGKEGVEDLIDSAIRDKDLRVDNIFIFAKGKAKDFLTTELKNKKVQSEFIYETLSKLRKISKLYMINTIDMANAISNPNRGLLVPIGHFIDREGFKELEIIGFSVVQNGKIAGEVPLKNFFGYAIVLDPITKTSFTAHKDNKRITFFIRHSKSSSKVSLVDDKLVVDVNIVMELVVLEIKGFKKITPDIVEEEFTNMAKEEIRKEVLKTLDYAKQINIDIYDFNSLLYKFHPKKYKKVSNEWDDVFKDLEMNIKIKTKISNVGQIYETINPGDGSE